MIFNVTLFFATCYWDGSKWKPLAKEQTEVDEAHQYCVMIKEKKCKQKGKE